MKTTIAQIPFCRIAVLAAASLVLTGCTGKIYRGDRYVATTEEVFDLPNAKVIMGRKGSGRGRGRGRSYNL